MKEVYNATGRRLCLSDLYTADETTEAAALYDGGWRATDKDELLEEYGMDERHATRLCEIFEWYEEEEK